MDLHTRMNMPPRTANCQGDERRVGVELEFAAISAREGASLVQSLFGGSICEEDPHRFHISNTTFGQFTSELDTQFAHKAAGESENVEASGDLLAEMLAEFRDTMRRIYGDISSLVVPCEIVCPPIPLSNLADIERLVDALSQAGAEGTRMNPLYAFGAQLNPEIATDDPAWLTAMLKSYLLLSDWLRAIMQIDTTRRIVAYADPFPPYYVGQVLDPNYWPDLEQVMDDYLVANPTRNRELDLLPLFAWMDGARVCRHVADPRVKPRPTFHYRLPDANFGEAGWSLTLEWNRWCVVEKLAEKRALLDAMCADYRRNSLQLLPANWAIKASEWLVMS